MKEFQKIAIGLLGLTHPEMFIPRPRAGEHPSAKPRVAAERRATGPERPRWQGRWQERAGRAVTTLRLLLTALAMGSRTVGLADNSELGRELAARARLLYGSHQGC
jgi:hypothetical protein